jgi:CheY-like chemotaxis protein
MRVVGPATDQQTVLLAEQNAPLREVLTGLLAEAGHRVLAVGSAPALIEQLRAPIRIDLLITDTRIRGLPGWQVMPAWEVMQEATRRRPGIPVLQLIDSRADAAPKCWRGAGPVRLLQKPFSITALLEAITALVKAGGA